MKRQYSNPVVAICLLVASCQSAVQKEPPVLLVKNQTIDTLYPQVQDIDNGLAHTDFVVSPDKRFPENKNIVYTPTLIAAWDVLVQAFDNTIKMSADEEDYRLLEQGRPYIAAMDTADYETSIDKTDRHIKVKAIFKKQLPFQIPFIEMPILRFKDKSVKSFGVKPDMKEQQSYLSVLYYKSNDDFILSITPVDLMQEIILVKGDYTSQNFTAVMQRIDEKRFKVVKGEGSKDIHLNNEILMMPKIAFNLEKQYKHLAGQTFQYKSADWVLESAYQQIAFKLDETGAEVESHSEMQAKKKSFSPLNKPREFIFDTDFYLILKDKRKAYPYFGLKIVDDELLVKE